MKKELELIALGIISFFTSLIPLISIPICILLMLQTIAVAKAITLKASVIIWLLMIFTLLGNVTWLYLYIFEWQIFYYLPKIQVF